MPGEDSAIQRAVAQLGKSLNLAEEASVHADEMLATTLNAFVGYRLAFGDEKNPSCIEISGRLEKAKGSGESAVAELAQARAAIRDLVRSIAPALELTDSSKVRSSPAGEELLDTSHRPRSVRAAMNQGARVSSDVGDLVKSGMEMHEKMTLAPPTPPEISGAAARVPQMESGQSSPAALAPQEIVGTLALTLAVGIKATIVVADRISVAFRRMFY